MSTEIKPGIAVGIIVAIIAGLVVLIIALRNSVDYEVGKEQRRPKPEPAYVIIDQEKADLPAKTQIVIYAATKNSTTAPEVEPILEDLYKKAAATRGFKYQGGKPTNIYIFLYRSLVDFQAGRESWIATLEKVGDQEPRISIDSDAISQLYR